MRFFVDLNNIEDIEYFVNKAKKYECEINVSNHNKTSVVNASSIMGLFTLNLSEPVEVSIKDDEVAELFMDEVYKLLV